MKICKNCTTINSPEATSCSKCSMKGMLVAVPTKAKEESAMIVIYHSCKNCGTSDTGKGIKCKQCSFPLPDAQSTHSKSDSSTSNTKVS